jgi:hypothetical protein
VTLHPSSPPIRGVDVTAVVRFLGGASVASVAERITYLERLVRADTVVDLVVDRHQDADADHSDAKAFQMRSSVHESFDGDAIACC